MFKVKHDQPTLFVNTPLVKNKKQLTTVIGSYFEGLTSKFLKLERLGLTNQHLVSPDLCNKDKTLYVESKASALTSGGVAIRKSQLNRYKDLIDFHFPDLDDSDPKFKINCNYCIWFYDVDLDNLGTEIPEDICDILGKNIMCGMQFDIDTILHFLKDSTSKNINRLKHDDLLKFINYISTRYINKERIQIENTKKFLFYKVS